MNLEANEPDSNTQNIAKATAPPSKSTYDTAKDTAWKLW